MTMAVKQAGQPSFLRLLDYAYPVTARRVGGTRKIRNILRGVGGHRQPADASLDSCRVGFGTGFLSPENDAPKRT